MSARQAAMSARQAAMSTDPVAKSVCEVAASTPTAALDTSRRRYDEFRRRYRHADPAQRDPQEDHVARADATTRRGYVREYVQWLWPFRWKLAWVLVLATVATLMGLVLPIGTQYAVDHILLGSRNTKHLTAFGVAMFLLILVQQAFYLARQWKMATLNAQVVTRLRRRLFRHLLHLPLGELSDLKTGRIVSRLSNDMDQVTGLVQIALITPGVAGIRVAATIVLLMVINWKMALMAAVFLPLLTAMNLTWVKRIRPVYRAIRRDRSDIDGRVTETFGGIRVVRGFAREPGEIRHFAVQNHAVIRKVLLARRFELFVALGWGLLIPLVSLLVIWYGGLRLLAGEVTIGGIMAFQMYIMMLLEPISIIISSYGETQQALAALERVFDILRRPTDMPDRPGARPAPRRVQQLAFENVEFAYRPGLPVLRGISLEVPAGRTVALVGPSGAGKTTVTNLVARFYDPTGGCIRLNGVDLRDVRLADYRRLLGIVQQDVFLFDGTVAENIGFSRRSATRAQIIAAARRANADEFIARLPEGYDTLVGERGVKLSGGQAQRLSIARAFLADPQILILDEATSNLDTHSEELIQSSMLELIAERTTFIIAHRLSTVMHADLIAVMEEGRTVQLGTHVELMGQGGLYRDMVERQFTRQSPETAGLVA